MTKQFNRNQFGQPRMTAEEKSQYDAIGAKEIAEAEEIQREAVRWTAKSGQEIEVYANDNNSFQVHVAGKGWYDECQFSSNVPDAAKAAGIVAKLGPIGVTAEQKSQIDAKRGR